MGTGRPRSFACAVVALALVAAAAPPPTASASSKGKHRIFRFGTRPLSKGAKGKDVRYLQRALSRLGVATSIDGVFGKGTLSSVEAFEQASGWPVNGVISKKDAKRIKTMLIRRRVSGGYFIEGYVNPTINLTSRKGGAATVRALDANGNIAQTLQVAFSGPESKAVPWDGTTPSGIASDGVYRFKLADPGTAKAHVSGGQTEPFALHFHQFPVPGPHAYGGPDGRFGAPRSGHIHQGQDLPAETRAEALRLREGPGEETNAYQAGGAGYYIVIHCLITGTDAVYMHLKAPSWAPAGTGVTAGQQIGKVGDTGDAQGCHLPLRAVEPPRAGTWAARPTTRFRSCSTGTATPSGHSWARTSDLRLVEAALSQLSYAPWG